MIYNDILEIMASLTCADLGIDCSFIAKGETVREIMRLFIDHAESAHKMSVLPADVIFQLQKAIKK
jgi:predicted small metal-binding protein